MQEKIPNKEFTKNLLSFLFNGIENVRRNNLIRKHTGKSLRTGCYSFPISLEIWNLYLTEQVNSESKEINLTVERIDQLIQASKTWSLQILNVEIKATRCFIALNRSTCFQSIINQILYEDDSNSIQKNPSLGALYFDKQSTGENRALTISGYRCQLILDLIRNLSIYYGYDVKEIDENVNVNEIPEERVISFKFGSMVCGPITGFPDNELSEYQRQRILTMERLAIVKHGPDEVKSNRFIQQSINELGTASIILELLETKYNTSIELKTTKRPSFILYNSARLETILRTFNDNINSKIYPPLPTIDQIDFNQLEEDEEWQLLFDYLIEFRSVIERAVGQINLMAPHTVCGYLNGFVKVFSVYYRRVKILTDNRHQLLPTMYARIYLLKCVQLILNKCLTFLGVMPIQRM